MCYVTKYSVNFLFYAFYVNVCLPVSGFDTVIAILFAEHFMSIHFVDDFVTLRTGTVHGQPLEAVETPTTVDQLKSSEGAMYHN